MGRFGRLSIKLPESVGARIEEGKIIITGPKGVLSRSIPRWISIVIDDSEINVVSEGVTKQALANQGTLRSHIFNMVKGVEKGWERKLEINGPGYRGEVREKDLILLLGYSHPITISAPEGINFKIEKSIISVMGIDKEVVGLTAAKVRGARKPDPYKGAGIKYQEEILRKKAGKQASGTQGG